MCYHSQFVKFLIFAAAFSFTLPALSACCWKDCQRAARADRSFRRKILRPPEKFPSKSPPFGPSSLKPPRKGYTVYAAVPVLVRVLPHLFCPPPYTMDGGFSISKDRREPKAPQKIFKRCLTPASHGYNNSEVQTNQIAERDTVKRGDIYYADLSPVVGSEQGGVRPVLIVQNDIGNRYSPTVIAAAITSQTEKAKLPTHIELHSHSCGCPKIRWCCWSRSAPSTSAACARRWAPWTPTRCPRSTRLYRSVSVSEKAVSCRKKTDLPL